MLGLAKMAPDAWRYYAAEIASGREDYWAGHGEEPGRWLGRGAEHEGMTGEVEVESLARLFGQGRHPITDEVLGSPFTERSVAGFALSLSPPKSASVLWAMGGEDVAAAVRAGHDAAVEAVVAYLDDHAAFSRTGHGGFHQVDSHGLLIAGFVHRTSRAMDPQLHSHLLVANRVRCGDGRWRALDARELYATQKAAGMLYQAALRAELTARLGISWAPVDANGQADVLGVPQALLEHFSTRRREVLAEGTKRVAVAEARLGRSLTVHERAAAYQLATYRSRRAKEDEASSTDALMERWRAEAAGLGIDGGWIKDALGGYSFPHVPHDAVVEEALSELERARSTWCRSDVVKALARRAPAPSSAEEVRTWVEHRTDAVIDDPDVVRLQAPVVVQVPEILRRRDGRPVSERHGATRYSTRGTLARESAVLEAVSRGREAERAVVADEHLLPALVGLGVDQAQAVSRLCAGGEAIACLVGPAGAGKTRSLAAARTAWEAAGIPVRGLAVSAVAAGVLSEEAGLPADTVAKFLHEHDRPEVSDRWQLRMGEVVCCDEAGMMSSADLCRLVQLTEEAGAKLVLIGDPAQLGSVEAGGLFRLLTADARTAELGTVRRFVEPWEAKASVGLRVRDRYVLDEYEAHGRLAGGDKEAMVEAAFASWRQSWKAGESVAVLAPDHATVDALAMRARELRVLVGEVEADGIVVGNQVVGVGDEVLTTTNDRRLLTSTGAWVRNGDRWRVTDRREGVLAVESLQGRGRVVLPPEYVWESLTLSYASTVHKSQGLTVDRAVAVIDERTSAEALYVALTRGRRDNRALVVTDDQTHAQPHRGPYERTHSRSHLDVLAGVLAHSGAERSATEVLRDQLDRSESLAVLVPELETARRYIDQQAGPDRSVELAHLQEAIAEHPQRVREAKEATRRLQQAEQRLVACERNLLDSEENLERLERRSRGWLRRPDERTLQQAKRHVVSMENNRASEAGWVKTHRERAEHAVEQARPVDQAHVAEVERAVDARQRWLAAHPAEVRWLESLAERVTARTEELAQRAETERPEHVVRLVGSPPEREWARSFWRERAGALEAHRERWDVSPAQLGRDVPVRLEQAAEWHALVPRLRPNEMERLLSRQTVSRDRGLGVGIEL